MEGQMIDDKKSFYIILILSLGILISGNTTSKQILFIVGLLCWSIIYIYSKKRYNREFTLIRMLILSIPLSFTNIFGRSYGESSLSWFNIFLLMMVTTYIFKYLVLGKAYFNHLSLLSIMLILISIIPVFWAENILDGFKQYINMIVLFILIILGNSLKKNLTDGQKYILKIDYILSTIIAGIGIVVQMLFVKILNITIGNYAFLGGYRHAYGFLFADYSFLSLYLVSGAMMMYFYKSKHLKSKKKWMMGIGFLLLTSILTSARTGIVAFIVIFAIYSVLNVLNLIKKGSIKGIIIIIGNIVVVIISYLLIGRTRNIAKFSDSGRNKLNGEAFKIFLDNPYWGIGFGSGNYIGMLPHNILFQSLAQGGILYTIPLILFLFVLLYRAYKKDIEMLPVFLCVLFGSFFIPNIFNSRFLPVLALMLSINI